MRCERVEVQTNLSDAMLQVQDSSKPCGGACCPTHDVSRVMHDVTIFSRRRPRNHRGFIIHPFSVACQKGQRSPRTYLQIRALVTTSLFQNSFILILNVFFVSKKISGYFRFKFQRENSINTEETQNRSLFFQVSSSFLFFNDFCYTFFFLSFIQI